MKRIDHGWLGARFGTRLVEYRILWARLGVRLRLRLWYRICGRLHQPLILEVQRAED